MTLNRQHVIQRAGIKYVTTAKRQYRLRRLRFTTYTKWTIKICIYNGRSPNKVRRPLTALGSKNRPTTRKGILSTLGLTW